MHKFAEILFSYLIGVLEGRVFDEVSQLSEDELVAVLVEWHRKESGR